MDTSRNWSLVITDKTLPSVRAKSPEDAFSILNGRSVCELGGDGELGDGLQLQVDEDHALILYMKPDQTILRPKFLNPLRNGDGVEHYFCQCCGVQLGDYHQMLSVLVYRPSFGSVRG